MVGREGQLAPERVDVLLRSCTLGGASSLDIVDWWLARFFLGPRSAGLDWVTMQIW
jgi:hypothetical protein